MKWGKQFNLGKKIEMGKNLGLGKEFQLRQILELGKKIEPGTANTVYAHQLFLENHTVTPFGIRRTGVKLAT